MARAIDRGRAAGHYEDSLRDIIHAFKYEGRRSLARPLAALMRRQAGDLLDGVDWVIPVPLHWRRERERGFNQASDLARALLTDERAHCLAAMPPRRRHENRLGRTWSYENSFAPPARRRPRLLHALRRVRHTRVQAELTAARRHKNVRNAFEVSDGFASALAGSCVLIVDDVSTTGATMDACARVLKDAAEVREIRAITAARVVTRPAR